MKRRCLPAGVMGMFLAMAPLADGAERSGAREGARKADRSASRSSGRAGRADQAAVAEVRVGIDEGDLRGEDHRALQAAVDYVAGLGGGVVRIAPGRYRMRNALTLRDNVRVIGTPGETVLVAEAGVTSALVADGDCNQRAISVADPDAFRIGDGVVVKDDDGGGFAVTTATITAKIDENSFALSRPLYLDYMVAKNARALRACPVVGAWNVANIAIEGLTIEGNREDTLWLDGCRGAGIYTFECENVDIRDCTVRGYNGDGISFQVSKNVRVEDCSCEGNAGLGLHPGSGSQRPIVRRNRSTGNGRDGLFVCWRVQHGLFEDNEIFGNAGAGVSIGHKDSDNLFRRNRIEGNGIAGVLFRKETEAMGAHRNVFEKNIILDNGFGKSKRARKAAIVIEGVHHDLVFRDNEIGLTVPIGPTEKPSAGVLASEKSQGLTLDGNRFRNVTAEPTKGP